MVVPVLEMETEEEISVISLECGVLPADGLVGLYQPDVCWLSEHLPYEKLYLGWVRQA
jgi:hypothetical protein